MKRIFALKTRGGSMRPLFRSGETVLIERCPPERLSPGDPVLYRDEHGRQYIHRIWKVARSGEGDSSFIIGDDAAVTRPHPVRPDQILGRPLRAPRGFTGLVWGRTCNLLFHMLRPLKRGALNRP